MTVQEISDRLDYALSQHVGGIQLDEYNKSLYLTKAQSTWAEEAYKLMEYTELVKQKANPLVQEVNLASGVFTQKTPTTLEPFTYFTPITQFNILGILWEQVNEITTIPMDYNDKHFTLRNPFRKPSAKIAYRGLSEDTLTVYLHEALAQYDFVFMKVPAPIVLEDLTGTGLDVGGVTAETTSVLGDEDMNAVIDLAVNMIVSDMSKTLANSAE